METDRGGRLPLHYAALDNNVELAITRLAHGDDPSLGDRDGFTPLHFAAQQASLEVARLLLDHGAEVNKPNKFGNSPLFTAVYNSRGRGEMIALLRERGADAFQANLSGQTPIGLADLIGNFNVRQFFAKLDGSDS